MTWHVFVSPTCTSEQNLNPNITEATKQAVDTNVLLEYLANGWSAAQNCLVDPHPNVLRAFILRKLNKRGQIGNKERHFSTLQCTGSQQHFQSSNLLGNSAEPLGPAFPPFDFFPRPAKNCTISSVPHLVGAITEPRIDATLRKRAPSHSLCFLDCLRKRSMGTRDI